MYRIYIITPIDYDRNNSSFSSPLSTKRDDFAEDKIEINEDFSDNLFKKLKVVDEYEEYEYLKKKNIINRTNNNSSVIESIDNTKDLKSNGSVIAKGIDNKEDVKDENGSVIAGGINTVIESIDDAEDLKSNGSVIAEGIKDEEDVKVNACVIAGGINDYNILKF
jgi:hypothetical protein